MNVRVADERGNAEREADAYRLTLSPNTPDSSPQAHGSFTEPLVFRSNPQDWEITQAANWVPRDALGVEPMMNRSDWVTSAPRTLPLRLLLQPDDPDECGRIIATLQAWAGRPTTITGQPTTVWASQGIQGFGGHISAFSYRALQTDATGRITTMELNLTLTENF